MSSKIKLYTKKHLNAYRQLKRAEQERAKKNQIQLEKKMKDTRPEIMLEGVEDARSR